VAWHPLGWFPAAFAEVDAFSSAVLAHRFPSIPNLGDMTAIPERANELGPVDLLVGGTPCQSFSVAGPRGGLEDPRGRLAFAFADVARALRPRWVVWENVPGVLSSGGGRDFGAFLYSLVDVGYRCAWRVLDAQGFGVPQRRRRVFVVGHLGGGRRAAEVLSLGESGPRDFEARRGAKQSPPAGPLDGVGGGCVGPLLAPTRNSGWRIDVAAVGGRVAHTLRGEGFDASEDGTGRGTPIVTFGGGRTSGHAVAWNNRGRDGGAQLEGPSPVASLRAASGGSSRSLVQAWAENSRGELRLEGGEGRRTGAISGPFVVNARQDPILARDVSLPLGAKDTGHAIGPRPAQTTRRPTSAFRHPEASVVRRLTPRECERLQGFPDDWTRIPYRGKGAAGCPDGPRYKAIGNSMAVPVMRWLGSQIAEADR